MDKLVYRLRVIHDRYSKPQIERHGKAGDDGAVQVRREYGVLELDHDQRMRVFFRTALNLTGGLSGDDERRRARPYLSAVRQGNKTMSQASLKARGEDRTFTSLRLARVKSHGAPSPPFSPRFLSVRPLVSDHRHGHVGVIQSSSSVVTRPASSFLTFVRSTGLVVYERSKQMAEQIEQQQ